VLFSVTYILSIRSRVFFVNKKHHFYLLEKIVEWV